MSLKMRKTFRKANDSSVVYSENKILFPKRSET